VVIARARGGTLGILVWIERKITQSWLADAITMRLLRD
jgi:hypothetical protein